MVSEADAIKPDPLATETAESLNDTVGEPSDDGRASADGRPGAPTIGTLLSRLVDDSEEFVRAEVRLYRAQAILRLIEARMAIMMIVIAAVILLATAIALLVGLIIILAPMVGRAAAVAIVVVGSLAIAWLLVQIALGKLRRATDFVEKVGHDEGPRWARR